MSSEIAKSGIQQMKAKQLPEFLVGDQIRLKQVLINVLKSLLRGISQCTISIGAHYDASTKLMVVEMEDDSG